MGRSQKYCFAYILGRLCELVSSRWWSILDLAVRIVSVTIPKQMLKAKINSMASKIQSASTLSFPDL